MPTLPTAPPADRFFARLQQFQCACPSCGRLLTSDQDQGHLAQHLLEGNQKPTTQKYRKRARTITAAKQLTWNPFTQRLRCPWCRVQFVAGLLLYPVGQRGKAALHEAPPDTTPTFAERQELRRLAAGWCSEAEYERHAPVNVYVPGTCTCPARGWARECALHGNRAKPQQLEGGESGKVAGGEGGEFPQGG